METYLENLKWRYATKKFDADKKLSDDQLNALMEAIRLSASSFGLQPYSVLVVEDPEIRAQLRKAAWDQAQLTDASHIIVFANNINFGDTEIDKYLDNVAATRNMNRPDLEGYGDFMKSKIGAQPEDQRAVWTSQQAYIALGNLLSAAATLKIDTCPMEGFDREVFDRILGLNEKGLSTAVIAAVGFRSEDDDTRLYPKVRKSKEELFTIIK